MDAIAKQDIGLPKSAVTMQANGVPTPVSILGSPESESTSYFASPASQTISQFGAMDSPASSVGSMAFASPKLDGKFEPTLSLTTPASPPSTAPKTKKIVVKRVVRQKVPTDTTETSTTAQPVRSTIPIGAGEHATPAVAASGTVPTKKRIIVKRVVRPKVSEEASTAMKPAPTTLPGPEIQPIVASAPLVAPSAPPATLRPLPPHTATAPLPERPVVKQTISTQSAPAMRTDASDKATEDIRKRYEQWANAWLKECELEYREKGLQVALVDLKKYLDRELPLMLTAEANVFQNNFSFTAWATLSGSAGLLPFGKTFVGGLAKHKIQKHVRSHFGVRVVSKAAAKKAQEARKAAGKSAGKPATTEKSNDKDAKKAEPDKKEKKEKKDQEATNEILSTIGDSSDVMADVADGLMDVATGVLGDVFFSFAEEIVHLLPGVGQVISFQRGYSRTKKEMRKAIVHAKEQAIRQHKKTVLLDLLQRPAFHNKVHPATHPIYVYRLPQCASCFLVGATSTSTCSRCTTHPANVGSPAFKPCPKRRHDKRIVREAKEHAVSMKEISKASKSTVPAIPPTAAPITCTHSRTWCTKRLLSKSRHEQAWGCIPCYLAYGKHKPTKCELNHFGACEYCGVEGHHAGACGTRLFHAIYRIQELQNSRASMRPEVDVGAFSLGRRVEWVGVGHNEIKRKNGTSWSKIGGHVVLVGSHFAKPTEGVCQPKTNLKQMGRPLR